MPKAIGYAKRGKKNGHPGPKGWGRDGLCKSRVDGGPDCLVDREENPNGLVHEESKRGLDVKGGCCSDGKRRGTGRRQRNKLTAE